MDQKPIYQVAEQQKDEKLREYPDECDSCQSDLDATVQ